MADINNTPMVNSADLAQVVSNADVVLAKLISSLPGGESGKHRSIGAGLHVSTGMSRAGGNDGLDVSLEAVQRWLDEGKLTLRDEPEPGTALARVYGSPKEFLAKHGLRDPREQPKE